MGHFEVRSEMFEVRSGGKQPRFFHQLQSRIPAPLHRSNISRHSSDASLPGLGFLELSCTLGFPRTSGPGSPQAIDNRAFSPPDFPCSWRLNGCSRSNIEHLTSQFRWAISKFEVRCSKLEVEESSRVSSISSSHESRHHFTDRTSHVTSSDASSIASGTRCFWYAMRVVLATWPEVSGHERFM